MSNSMEKRNLKSFEELALAYERQGQTLHPMLRRLTSHLRWVDCVHRLTSCKHYKDKKCKLTHSSRIEYCPMLAKFRKNYPSSATPLTLGSNKTGLPQSSFPKKVLPDIPATRALGDGIFRYTSGKGFYCVTCHQWLRCSRNNNTVLIEHTYTKKHRNNLMVGL